MTDNSRAALHVGVELYTRIADDEDGTLDAALAEVERNDEDGVMLTVTPLGDRLPISVLFSRNAAEEIASQLRREATGSWA